MAASVHGRRLLQSLLADKKGTEKFLHFGLAEDYFQGEELDIWWNVEAHLAKHGRLPKPATIKLPVPDDLEPPEYYLNLVRERYQHSTLKSAVFAAHALIADKDLDTATDTLREALLKLTTRNQGTHMSDFLPDGAKLLDDEYRLLTKLNAVPGVMTGYPYLDNMSGGGLRGGDVLAIVGRPQQGKTYQLLHMAHHAWHTQGKRVLFVSMEMKPLPVIQRLTAMHEHMSITLLRKAEIPKAKHKELINSMKVEAENHENFWIIDGNLAATIQDVVLMCHQMQPDAVYIDGAYLLGHADDKRMARWDRIGTVIEIAKARIATDMGIPVFATYQFNKEGAKTKDLESIGGTDRIGQIASIVLALHEKENDEGTYNSRKKVEVIKGRHGESGEFWIRWLFDVPPFMRFDEIADEETSTEDLDDGYV